MTSFKKELETQQVAYQNSLKKVESEKDAAQDVINDLKIQVSTTLHNNEASEKIA